MSNRIRQSGLGSSLYLYLSNTENLSWISSGKHSADLQLTNLLLPQFSHQRSKIPIHTSLISIRSIAKQKNLIQHKETSINIKFFSSPEPSLCFAQSAYRKSTSRPVTRHNNCGLEHKLQRNSLNNQKLLVEVIMTPRDKFQAKRIPSRSKQI